MTHGKAGWKQNKDLKIANFHQKQFIKHNKLLPLSNLSPIL